MKKLPILSFMILFALTTAISNAYAIDYDAIKTIESSGIADAFNPKTGARGLYQITPICLKDFNQQTRKKYKTDDLDLIWVNREIAVWYLEKRIPQILKANKKKATQEALLVSYNAGHTYVGKKLPKETVNYLRKYKRLVKG